MLGTCYLNVRDVLCFVRDFKLDSGSNLKFLPNDDQLGNWAIGNEKKPSYTTFSLLLGYLSWQNKDLLNHEAFDCNFFVINLESYFSGWQIYYFDDI